MGVGCMVVVWVVVGAMVVGMVEGSWCIARSGASAGQLQAGLDYACGSGADCTPIQPSGLCYLPNTVPAHASYAFNSYYQRSNAAPGSCDFTGSATVTVSDPSYGSCTYPSSLSTAGGSGKPSTPSITPNNTPTSAPTFGGTTGAGGLTPGLVSPTLPTFGTSTAAPLLPLLMPIMFCYLALLL